MGCNICLDENDELINVLGPEGFQLNIAFVLAKHFTFCFEVNIYRIVLFRFFGKLEVN